MRLRRSVREAWARFIGHAIYGWNASSRLRFFLLSLPRIRYARRRVDREAKTISALNHPHICALYDVGSQGGVDFLVMEYVQGETLAKRLEKGPLPPEQVLSTACKSATRSILRTRGSRSPRSEARQHHADGGGRQAVRLRSRQACDACGQHRDDGRHAHAFVSADCTGVIAGTIPYMSPEQLKGTELDGRSDIFSLGAVLYEMLTAQRAFGGKDQLSVASAILEKEPVAAQVHSSR